MMGKTYQLLVFKLDSRLFALHLAVVDGIVRAVRVTLLPEGPETVLGVVNLKGKVVPTFNLRRRFQMPERDIDPGDQLIIAHTARRPVACLVVDAVGEIIERGDQDVIASGEIFPGLDHVEGVAKIEDGIVMIHDLLDPLSFFARRSSFESGNESTMIETLSQATLSSLRTISWLRRWDFWHFPPNRTTDLARGIRAATKNSVSIALRPVLIGSSHLPCLNDRLRFLPVNLQWVRPTFSVRDKHFRALEDQVLRSLR